MKLNEVYNPWLCMYKHQTRVWVERFKQGLKLKTINFIINNSLYYSIVYQKIISKIVYHEIQAIVP